MKTAGVFAAIVFVAFIGIFMLTNQSGLKSTQDPNNFLTPSPTPTVSLSTPTPVPTVAENKRVSAKSAIIKTAKGDIAVDLFASEAAKTVMNFATHSNNGYYNNLTFHRVEPWVIQGGDPNGNGSGGVSIYGPTFEDEIDPNNDRYKEGYVTGILAMANRGPNTNGSQFFIIKQTTPLQPSYTIFGKVTKGMEVVQSITPGDKILTIQISQ